MIEVIGKNNCSRCVMTKKILTDKNIEFTYKLIEDLSEDIQEQYINLATESKQMSFPLIIKDNKLVSLQEV